MPKLKDSDLREFTTFLLEFGKLYRVEEDGSVVFDSDGKPVTMNVGQNIKNCYTYMEGMTDPNGVVLNPMISTDSGTKGEEAIFIDRPALILREFIRSIIKGILNIPNQKDSSFKNIDLAKKVIKLIDTKSIDEFEKIKNQHDIFTIFYDRKTKTAQAQTSLFDDELKKVYTGIRVKTWNAIRKIMKELFGMEDIHTFFRFTSKSVSVPKPEAFWQVIRLVSEQINDKVKAINSDAADLHPEIFRKYLPHIEEMYQLSRWLPSSGAAVKATGKGPRIIEKSDTPASGPGPRIIATPPAGSGPRIVGGPTDKKVRPWDRTHHAKITSAGPSSRFVGGFPTK